MVDNDYRKTIFFPSFSHLCLFWLRVETGQCCCLVFCTKRSVDFVTILHSCDFWDVDEVKSAANFCK